MRTKRSSLHTPVSAAESGKSHDVWAEQARLSEPPQAEAEAVVWVLTGDLVRAVIPGGKYAGTHIGRIAVRSRPLFKLSGFDVHPKYLRVIQWADGYAYAMRKERS